MTLGNTLGTGLLAQIRLGDEKATGIRPVTVAISIPYTIATSQHGKAISITYSIQKTNTAPMLLYYVIAPYGAFAINGVSSIVAPDRLIYTPRPVAGRTMLGQPIYQGYVTMTWSYAILQQAEYHYLLSFYNPQNPTVLITYPDDLGVWQQRNAVMRPPNYGSATNVVYTNVVLTFTRLSSSIL